MEDLEDEIRNTFPLPIAERYAKSLEPGYGGGAFGSALDALEATIDLLVAATIGIYIQSENRNESADLAIRTHLQNTRPTVGHVVELLRGVVASLPAGLPEGFSDFATLLKDAKGKSTLTDQTIRRLVTARNKGWGHSKRRDDDALKAALPDFSKDIRALLGSLKWLSGHDLWVPSEIAAGGHVRRAVLYRGTSRREADVSLRRVELGKAELSANGGPVQEGRTPLLVSRESRHAVPLAPFAFADGGSIWFLTNMQPGGRGGVECHTYQSSERRSFDVQSFEARRAQVLAQAVAPAPTPDAPPPVARPQNVDPGIPGVWAEQTQLLRSFVGREDVLASLEQWAAHTADGGYRVFFGPPGQGKSALLARLAFRFGVGPAARAAGLPSRGAVLHHVKQKKDPVAILRSLLAQARSLTGAPPPGDEGDDVETLRNALVGEMERVAELGRTADPPHGAVLILDALDELGGLDLSFLPPSLPPGVRGVLSCRPGIPLVQALRDRVRPLEEVGLRALARRDLDAVLAMEIEPAGAAAVGAAVDLGEVFRRTGGTPLLIHGAVTVLREAFEVGSYDDVVGRVPDTLASVFSRQVSRAIGAGDGADLRERVLGVLAVAQEPLAPQDVHAVLQLTGDAPPFRQMRRELGHLSELLVGTPEGDRLYHEGLAEYVLNAVLGPDAVGLHDALADWGAAGRTPAGARYGRLYGPVHLAAAATLAEEAGVDADPLRDRLRRALMSFDELANAAEHGALYSRGQVYWRTAESLPEGDRAVATVWGEFARAEAGRSVSADDLRQQALLLPDDHPVHRAVVGIDAPASRPLLLPIERPDPVSKSGQLVLGPGPAVERVAPYSDGFAVIRRTGILTFGWDGGETDPEPFVLDGLIDSTDCAVHIQKGRFEVEQRPEVQAALSRDPGSPADYLTGPKSTAVLADGHVVVGSGDALRVYMPGSDEPVREVTPEFLLGDSKEALGLSGFFDDVPVQLKALGGGRHIVAWTVRVDGDVATAHYAVWDWVEDVVRHRVSARSKRPKEKQTSFAKHRDSIYFDSSPIVLPGGWPRYALRTAIDGGIPIFDTERDDVVHVQTGAAVAVSPDGRYLFDRSGQPWDTETGEKVGPAAGTWLGFSADGSRSLANRHRSLVLHHDEDSVTYGPDIYELTVTDLLGGPAPGAGTIRSRRFVDASTIALGVDKVAIAEPDGSVRLIPLDGESALPSSKTNPWTVANAEAGILKAESWWIEDGLPHVWNQWRTLDPPTKGEDMFRNGDESGGLLNWPEVAEIPDGLLLGVGGYQMVDGDPCALAVYALSSEPGTALVRQENLRQSTSVELFKYSYTEHYPDFEAWMASPPRKRSPSFAPPSHLPEPLGDGKAFVLGLEADSSNSIMYFPSPSGETEARPSWEISDYAAMDRGEFVLVSESEPQFIDLGEDEEGMPDLAYDGDIKVVRLIDARSGTVIHSYEGARLLAADDTVALVVTDRDVVAWDWAKDRELGRLALPQGVQQAQAALCGPGRGVVTWQTGPADSQVTEAVLWLWRSGGRIQALDLPEARLESIHTSDEVAVLAGPGRLVAVDLESGRVGSVYLDGPVSAHVWRDEVVATDRTGFYRFHLDLRA